MISVVFPAYNEEENVVELHRQLKLVLDSLKEPYEIIAVDNASTDRTREKLLTLSPVKIISLAKNLGQTAGLDAGVHSTRGDVIVIMDADLQNDPADIPHLLEKLREGFGLAVGWRKDRRDSSGRLILSRLANWFTRRVTGLHLHDYACALKAFESKYIKGVHLYGEMHVFLPAILASRGAKIVEVPVRHHARSRGVSKHTFLKAVKDVADLLTIKFLYTYSSRPFVFFGGWGVANIALGGMAGTASVILKIFEIRDIGQTPLPIFSALFIILGFILFMMGFLAELMVRIYYESRKETPYVISEIVERN